MDNRQKKCPTPEETVSGTGVVMKVICRPVKGRADYSKFIPVLQEVSGYSFDEFTTKLLQRKKFLFDDCRSDIKIEPYQVCWRLFYLS